VTFNNLLSRERRLHRSDAHRDIVFRYCEKQYGGKGKRKKEKKR